MSCLQLGDTGHGPVAEGVQLVVRQLALADIGADAALRVGGGHAAIGERPGGRAAFQRAIGVLHAERAAENRRVGDLDVGQKTLRPVAAVEQDALVVVVRVVVVPVHERGGRAGGELHGVHREHAGHVHFAGAGHELSLIMLISVQTLQPKFCCTEVQHWMAVASRALASIHSVRITPSLGHLQQLLGRHAGRGRVSLDFGQLAFDGLRAGVQLAGFGEDFGQVHRGDADAVAFEDLLAVTDGVERAGPRADGAQAHAAQALHHAADAEEALQVGGEAVRGRDGRHAWW